jgi:DNA-binding CsgD family transcriptional regulator
VSPSHYNETEPAALQGVICFDDTMQVIVASSVGVEFSKELFACTPRVGEMLPDEVCKCLAELKEKRSPHAEVTPKLDIRKDGKCFAVSFAADPQGNHHCMIFERRKEFTSPDQLKPLRLSPRETHVAYWILHQKTNWEIGRILEISTRTVDKHVERIFLKIGVNDRRDLILKAQETCDA